MADNIDPINTSSTPESTPNPITPPIQNPKKNPKKTLLIIVFALLLLGAAGASGYFLSQKMNPSNPETPIQTEVTNTNTIPEATTPEPATPFISWIEPQKIASLGLYPTTKTEEDFDAVIDEQATYSKLGTINKDVYKGYDIILVTVDGGLGGGGSRYLRFIKNEDKIVFLTKYSTERFENDRLIDSKFTEDKTFAILDLDFPKTITGASPRQILTKTTEANGINYIPFDKTNLTKAFTDAKLGDVYTSTKKSREFNLANKITSVSDVNSAFFGKSGFYIKSPDGGTVAYNLDIDFIKDKSTPEITYLDGKNNTKEFLSTDIGGCGSTNFISVVDDINVTTDLEKIGTNSKGDDIYKLKDTNNTLLKNFYDNNYFPEGKKLAYKDFVAKNPLIFWVDPFNRIVKFTDVTYIPAAECGKPVIYLYPKETTQINVQVEPQGGFTYTDPVYPEGGWNVLATPQGKLTYLLDNKPYPYLFWEGRGGLYEKPKQGFVVKKAEVYSFLQQKLAELGLNTQESVDFLEFWYPRMQAKPYYFISFLGNQVMDKLAPLNITPKPDTVIRVLMDYTPLDQPIEVEGFKIKTPERKGFTVVEWGGVIQ
jgi:hypothetical protein